MNKIILAIVPFLLSSCGVWKYWHAPSQSPSQPLAREAKVLLSFQSGDMPGIDQATHFTATDRHSCKLLPPRENENTEPTFTINFYRKTGLIDGLDEETINLMFAHTDESQHTSQGTMFASIQRPEAKSALSTSYTSFVEGEPSNRCTVTYELVPGYIAGSFICEKVVSIGVTPEETRRMTGVFDCEY